MPNRGRDADRSSPRTQRRDEYGQFTSSGTRQRSRYDDERSSRSRWEDDDRRSSSRARRDDDDDRFCGDEGRSRRGRHSSEMQERDEQGQFTGYNARGRGRSRDDDDYDDRHASRRSSSRSRYDDDDERFGGDEGRSRGGRHSAEMQERDEQGQFIGYSSRGRGRSRYDDDDDRQSGWRSSSRSRYVDDDDRFGGEQDRSRGARYSAAMPERDEQGQFIGYSSRGRGRFRDHDDDEDDDRRSSRRVSARAHHDDERFGGEEGRARGGRHSAEIQPRDEQGQFAGYGGRGRGRSRDRDDD